MISVDPGLDITIPNHELIKPYVDINKSGQEYIANSTDVRLTAFSSLDAIQLNQLPVLGRPFFSSAYMMVDNDQRQATLWQAKPAQNQNLRAAGPPPCSASTSTASPTAILPSSTPTITSTTGSSSTISKGGIAGVSVVAAVFIAAFFGVGYFLAKSRSRRQGTDGNNPSKHSSVESEGLPHFNTELPTDQHPPAEMPLSEAGVPGPYEMNGGGFPKEKAGYEQRPFEMQGDYGHDVTVMEMPSTPWNRASIPQLPATPEMDKSPPPLPGSRAPVPPVNPQPPNKVATSPKRKPLPVIKGGPNDENPDHGRAWI